MTNDAERPMIWAAEFPTILGAIRFFSSWSPVIGSSSAEAGCCSTPCSLSTEPSFPTRLTDTSCPSIRVIRLQPWGAMLVGT